jgi:hypothetical protein
MLAAMAVGFALVGGGRRETAAAAPAAAAPAMSAPAEAAPAKMVPAKSPPAKILPAEAAPASMVPAQATVTPGHIVVRGTIYYTDRLGDRNHPATGIRVEIWDRDGQFPATGEKIGETVTDADGRFESREIRNVDPDGPVGAPEGTQDVFLKLVTSAGAIQLWTYVNLAEAWYYLQEHTGRDPGSLLAFWSKGSQDGPRYDVDARELHFRDEDAGYPDTVIHYATYALLHNIYGTLPDAWLDCIASVPVDPRLAVEPACALVHGLAVFLPLGAHHDPGYETASLRTLDMDAAGAGTAGWEDGDRVPGRIAGAFWDLHEGDETEEAFDAFNATFSDVWEVFATHKPDTMAEWWDGWKDLGKDGCGAVGSLFQNTIDYNTPPVVQPIPDVVIDEDDSAIVDLKNYVDDPECDDDRIAFELIDAGAPEAGVKLLPTNVISITPEADWFGRTTVKLRVSDGLVGIDMSFNVIVRSRNDCPFIKPRVQDPPPARYTDPIVLDLEVHGHDTEDDSSSLAWDVEIDPKYKADLTVLGRGGTTLTFLLEARFHGSYSVIVTLVLRDTDGCEVRQAVALYWTAEGNGPPSIRSERFTREYRAPMNTTIRVDLTGVADDPEDGAAPLEWFVLNAGDLNAQVHKVDRQILDFEPQVGFLGSNEVQLEVQDTGAARTTAAITLIWTSREDVSNQPPRILRHKLLGRTVGVGSDACYDLTDKAVDPDHNQLSLRWYAEPDDDRDLFVGAQGTRRLCLAARHGYEGCQWAVFIVRDPRDAEDRHDVHTCWRTMDLLLPVAMK